MRLGDERTELKACPRCPCEMVLGYLAVVTGIIWIPPICISFHGRSRGIPPAVARETKVCGERQQKTRGHVSPNTRRTAQEEDALLMSRLSWQIRGLLGLALV